MTKPAEAEEQQAIELAHRAEQAVKGGNLSDATRFLRQATTLAQENAQVRSAWVDLKQAEQRSPLLGICRDWVTSRNESDGEKALRLVKGQSLSNKNGEEAFEILLDYVGEDDILDEVTGELLKNPGAQLSLAKAVVERPTKTYYELFERGDDSITGLLRVLLNRDVWPSEEKWVQAHRDCFMLSLAMMMEKALDHPERAMKGVAQLLAAHAEHLKGIIDADSFNVILESLDIRVSTELRSHATLATVKLMELAPETAQTLITSFVTNCVKNGTAGRLILAFSAASSIFPIAVAAAAALFLQEGFLSTLVPTVQNKKSHKLEQAALELLNAACVDKACREAIRLHCFDWLQELVASPSTSRHSSNLAAVILVKLDQDPKDATQQASKSQSPEIVVPGRVDQNELVSRFTNMVISPDTLPKRDAIEGLAFASLRPQVRETLGNDTRFLRSLIDTMKHPNTSTQTLYGGLTILVNLTEYLPIQSEEEKRMAQLKAYANTQKPSAPDPLVGNAHVTQRCKNVLDAGIMPLLVSVTRTASPGVITSAVRIIYALSWAKPHRGPLAQQGAIKLLFQICDNISTLDNPSTFPSAQLTKFTAAQALAKILISTNPHHVFSAALPSTSAIRPLVSLLFRPEEDEDGRAKAWQLHAFEALLALTNLASFDTTTQNSIINSAFTIVNDELLLSQNELVRRAAVELICNLMASPQCIAKFADPADREAKRRLQVLLAMADVDDVATRSAAGGALAMLLGSCDEAIEAVLAQERGVEVLLGLCRDENEDVRLRGVVSVRGVVAAEGEEVAKRGREAVKAKGGVEVLKGVVGDSRRQDVLSGAVECLQILSG
jgi:hypothetical protein